MSASEPVEFQKTWMPRVALRPAVLGLTFRIGRPPTFVFAACCCVVVVCGGALYVVQSCLGGTPGPTPTPAHPLSTATARAPASNDQKRLRMMLTSARDPRGCGARLDPVPSYGPAGRRAGRGLAPVPVPRQAPSPGVGLGPSQVRDAGGDPGGWGAAA